ncbi:MAG: hypothetical protein KJT03_08170 [Verrucomicrobiae bacterium]|nr:hypothetical protein [Verrucomicrobiae bacterium]
MSRKESTGNASNYKVSFYQHLFWPTNSKVPGEDEEEFQKHYPAWLVRLRWIAIVIIISLAALNAGYLHYVDEEPMQGIWLVISVLLASNIFYQFGYGTIRWLQIHGLFLQIGLDLILLTALLHFSGGLENPFAFAYIFHVILAAIVFKRKIAFGVVLYSGILMAVLAFGELSGLLHHYTISAFPHFEHEDGIHHAALDVGYASIQFGLHFLLLVLGFGLVTTLMERIQEASSRIQDERLKLNHVIQTTGIGLAVIDKRDLAIECLNPADAIWQPLGGDSSDALWREWLRKLAEQILTEQKNEVMSYESHSVSKNSGVRYCQINLSFLGEPDQEDALMAALLWDVTERKRMEAEMSHADRIAMLGKISAGIAHEVGNPLASISSRLSLLEDADDLEEIKSGLKPLHGQVARINRIVRAVSQVARPKQGSWAPFDLREAITETLDVLNLHKGAKRCDVTYHPLRHAMQVAGVKDQLNQVFLNLALNAVDAMPKGGALEIFCEEDDQSYSVNFKDTGTGMSQEEIERVFDLFFTTKNSGLGMGMHIAYQIINAHQGTIEINSEISKGTTFCVKLPKDNGESIPSV